MASRVALKHVESQELEHLKHLTKLEEVEDGEPDSQSFSISFKLHLL